MPARHMDTSRALGRPIHSISEHTLALYALSRDALYGEVEDLSTSDEKVLGQRVRLAPDCCHKERVRTLPSIVGRISACRKREKRRYGGAGSARDAAAPPASGFRSWPPLGPSAHSHPIRDIRSPSATVLLPA